jgi:zinc protease
MKPTFCAFLFVAALCLNNVTAAAVLSPAQSGGKTATRAPEIKYERYKLANGLEVLLHEDHKLPIVAVDIWYHVGPVKERAGRTGFAHLF